MDSFSANQKRVIFSCILLLTWPNDLILWCTSGSFFVYDGIKERTRKMSQHDTVWLTHLFIIFFRSEAKRSIEYNLAIFHCKGMALWNRKMQVKGVHILKCIFIGSQISLFLLTLPHSKHTLCMHFPSKYSWIRFKMQLLIMLFHG